MIKHKNWPLGFLAVLFVAPSVFAQTAPAAPADAAAKPPISNEEIEQLVAPIALYPDSLVSQVLMAATYPLEVVEADRFAKANANLKGDPLADALEKQTWDPSVKSLVNFPQVLGMMSEKLNDTVKLGDAFISNQAQVLSAIQTLRAKAQSEGNLKSTPEQNVTVVTPPDSSIQVIQIAPTNPQVIYVPTYNPTVVYGTWPYPAYPPFNYHPPGYVAAGVIGFGVGVACGAAWGYAWGNCNWGHNDVNVNVNQNNNFNTKIDRSKYQNQINSNNTKIGGGANANTFQHDPSHRQGVAYRDNATAQKLGAAPSNQAIQSRDQYRGRDTGAQNLPAAGAAQNRPNTGAVGAGGSGVQNRPNTGAVGTGGAGAQPRPNTGAVGAGGGTAQNRPATPQAKPATGGGSGAFGGVNSSGSSVNNASQRGNSSRSASPSPAARPAPRAAPAARPSGGGGGGRR